MPEHFNVQTQVQNSWREYLDTLLPNRSGLYQHCLRLTGNLWDAEDLAQDALAQVFSLLGKTDAELDNPSAYLAKTATNLWIDRTRRTAKEHSLLNSLAIQLSDDVDTLANAADARTAASQLLQQLHPQERAAVVLKDILSLSLQECADLLSTSAGAIKAALHRGRSRLDKRSKPAVASLPDKALVSAFMEALATTDLATLKQLCATDLRVEMVGGAESRTFDEGQSFFQHAHFVMPALGFGENPRWAELIYQDEPVILGYRTLNGMEGINEVHRLETLSGMITRIRCYCFCPDTLQALGTELNMPVLVRPYRSPSPQDYSA